MRNHSLIIQGALFGSVMHYACEMPWSVVAVAMVLLGLIGWDIRRRRRLRGRE